MLLISADSCLVAVYGFRPPSLCMLRAVMFIICTLRSGSNPKTPWEHCYHEDPLWSHSLTSQWSSLQDLPTAYLFPTLSKWFPPRIRTCAPHLTFESVWVTDEPLWNSNFFTECLQCCHVLCTIGPLHQVTVDESLCLKHRLGRRYIHECS